MASGINTRASLIQGNDQRGTCVVEKPAKGGLYLRTAPYLVKPISTQPVSVVDTGDHYFRPRGVGVADVWNYI